MNHLDHGLAFDNLLTQSTCGGAFLCGDGRKNRNAVKRTTH